MAISEILLMSDTDTTFTMGVGSIVVPLDPRDVKMLAVPACYDDVTEARFGSAIVVSMSPFTLVSEQATMRWQTTVDETKFKAIGQAMPEAIARCMARLSE